LNQKDTELDQQLDEITKADEAELDRELDELDRNNEAAEKDLREGLRQKLEDVKKGIKDRKDGLRQKLEAPKDHASKEAEHALKKMEEDLSNEDLVSAHIDRWIANQWLKASK
jgi:hypothetical protein